MDTVLPRKCCVNTGVSTAAVPMDVNDSIAASMAFPWERAERRIEAGPPGQHATSRSPCRASLGSPSSLDSIQLVPTSSTPSIRSENDQRGARV
eukprot:1195210-Prorocentrum_minimum.AAC.1